MRTEEKRERASRVSAFFAKHQFFSRHYYLFKLRSKTYNDVKESRGQRKNMNNVMISLNVDDLTIWCHGKKARNGFLNWLELVSYTHSVRWYRHFSVTLLYCSSPINSGCHKNSSLVNIVHFLIVCIVDYIVRRFKMMREGAWKIWMSAECIMFLHPLDWMANFYSSSCIHR